MLKFAPPSLPLRPYVDGYVYVHDVAGAARGLPIKTAPHPGGVLTFNFGRPNRTGDGAATPTFSLLGMQTSARMWRSDVDSHFVMALLTPAGLARFTPELGADTADNLIDLSSILGLRTVKALVADMPACTRWCHRPLPVEWPQRPVARQQYTKLLGTWLSPRAPASNPTSVRQTVQSRGRPRSRLAAMVSRERPMMARSCRLLADDAKTRSD
jgi:hypothetical protein